MSDELIDWGEEGGPLVSALFGIAAYGDRGDHTGLRASIVAALAADVCQHSSCATGQKWSEWIDELCAVLSPLAHRDDELGGRADGLGQFIPKLRIALAADTASAPAERALAELVDKIVPGLDSGDLLADARTASAHLDAVSPSPAHAGICEPDKLHAAIMNLPCKVPAGYPFGSELCAGVYRQGHRDARQAAAELVSAAAPDVGKAQAPSWQPIETAPKDETNILLTNGKEVAQGWWVDEPGYIREHRDLDGHYIDQDESDGFQGWMDCDGGMQPDPTHWMPLPDAPAAIAQSAPRPVLLEAGKEGKR